MWLDRRLPAWFVLLVFLLGIFTLARVAQAQAPSGPCYNSANCALNSLGISGTLTGPDSGTWSSAGLSGLASIGAAQSFTSSPGTDYFNQLLSTYNFSGGSFGATRTLNVGATVSGAPNLNGNLITGTLALQGSHGSDTTDAGASQWTALQGIVTKTTPSGGFSSLGGLGGWGVYLPYSNDTNLPSSISGSDTHVEADMWTNNLDTSSGRFGYQTSFFVATAGDYTPEVAHPFYLNCGAAWCGSFFAMGGNYEQAALDLRFSDTTEPEITSSTPGSPVYSVTVDDVMPLASGGQFAGAYGYCCTIMSTAAITGITASSAASGTSLPVSALSGEPGGQSGETDYLTSGMYVIDVTNPTDVPANTTITVPGSGATLTTSASTTVANGDTLIFSRAMKAVTINGDSYVVAAFTLPTENSKAGTVYFQGAVTVADATNGNHIVPAAHTIWLWEGTSGPPIQPPDDIAFNRAGTDTLHDNGGGGLELTGEGLEASGIPLSITLSGCACNGTTDDTSAVNTFLAANPGATVTVPANGAVFMNTGNMTVPAGTVIEGLGAPNTTSSAGSGPITTSRILLNPAYSIVLGNGSGLKNIAILRSGMTANPTDAQVISAVAAWGADSPPSIGVMVPNNVGAVHLQRVLIEGFTFCAVDGGALANSGAADPGGTIYAQDVAGDCYNGPLVTQVGDNSILRDFRMEPFYALASTNVAPSGGETENTNAAQGSASADLSFTAASVTHVQAGDYAAVLTGADAGDIPYGTKVSSVNTGTGAVVLNASTTAALANGTPVTFGGAWARPGVGFYIAGPQQQTTGFYLDTDLAFMWRTGVYFDGTSSLTDTAQWAEWANAEDPSSNGQGTVGIRVSGPQADTYLTSLSTVGFQIPMADETTSAPLFALGPFAQAPDQGGPVPAGTTDFYLGGESGTPVVETLSGTATATGNATVTLTDASIPGSPLAVSTPVFIGETAAYAAQLLEFDLNTNVAVASAHIYAELNNNVVTIAAPAAQTLTATQSVPTGLSIAQTAGTAINGSSGTLLAPHQTSTNTSVPFLTIAPNAGSWNIRDPAVGAGTQGLYSGWASISNTISNTLQLTGMSTTVLSNSNISCTGTSCSATNSGGTAKDQGGRITETSPTTGVTITFMVPWPVSPPYCTVQGLGATQPTPAAATTTSFSWTNTAPGASQDFLFACRPTP